MKNFEYYNPVRVIFGAGEVCRCGEEAKKLGTKVCLVSYKELHLCLHKGSMPLMLALLHI